MTAPADSPDTSADREFRRKVCLVGDERVGKTSLIRRFATGRFDDAYLRTLGALVTRRNVSVDEPPGQTTLFHMMIWDIMGDRRFEALFREAYFAGAAGVIAVFDLTRPETLASVPYWLDGVRSAIGDVPAIVLANKADLQDRISIDDGAISATIGARGHPVLRTSARTGENVEQAFLGLAQAILGKK